MGSNRRSEEHRRSFRVQGSWETRLWKRDARTGLRAECVQVVVWELSRTGALVQLAEVAWKGLAVELDLGFVAEGLVARARVVRTDPRSPPSAGKVLIGLRFAALPLEATHAITRFTLAHAKASGQGTAPVAPGWTSGRSVQAALRRAAQAPPADSG